MRRAESSSNLGRKLRALKWKIINEFDVMNWLMEQVDSEVRTEEKIEGSKEWDGDTGGRDGND